MPADRARQQARGRPSPWLPWECSPGCHDNQPTRLITQSAPHAGHRAGIQRPDTPSAGSIAQRAGGACGRPGAGSELSRGGRARRTAVRAALPACCSLSAEARGADWVLARSGTGVGPNGGSVAPTVSAPPPPTGPWLPLHGWPACERQGQTPKSWCWLVPSGQERQPRLHVLSTKPQNWELEATLETGGGGSDASFPCSLL